MKKSLLFAICCGIISTALTAQTSVQVHPQMLVKPNKAAIVPFSHEMNNGIEEVGNQAAPAHPKPSFSKIGHTHSAPNSAVTTVGTTNYDLHTNAAVARRLLNHGNGTLSAVWTFATDNGPSYSSRGTGYSFYNGTSWSTPNTTRLEGATRTGWPNIGVLGTGKEIIISHDPAVYKFQQGTNSAVGSASPWTFAQSGATGSYCGTNGSIWARIAVSGTSKNFVHVISEAGDTSASCKLMGVRQPAVYARSTDEGATWPIKDVTLPGYDSTMTKSGSADNYAIDSRDSVVAIVIGGYGENVTLWKSTNDGTTFTKSYIDSVTFYNHNVAVQPDFDLSAAVGDTADTNDGSVTVLVDKDHKVHAAYGYGMIYRANDAGGTPGSFINVGFTTIVYWNEITDSLIALFPSIADVDVDGDNVYTVADSSFSLTKCRYGSGSLASKPSIAADDNGNIFIIFSMPQDADSSDEQESFRDIWVYASDNNGLTWKSPLNLTCSFGVEEAFATTAKVVDTDLHILFMSDGNPGTALTNGDADGQNDINYIKVPIANIMNGTAGCKFNSIGDELKSDLFAVSDNYPNPFTKVTSFEVSMYKSGSVSVIVTNILGQEVMQNSYSRMGAGNHTLTIDGSKLHAGVYFYTVKSGDMSVTKKMIVQ